MFDRDPPEPRDAILDMILESELVHPFQMDKEIFLQNLRAAGGPSGMRNEHLRPLLHNDADNSRFFEVSQAFAQAKIPDEIVSALRVGRGSRMPQSRFNMHCPPEPDVKAFIAHVVQVLTDNNAATTVLSIDGVGAFKLISRQLDVIFLFVLQFFGRPSTHLWIQQGEGGEQGDPLMPSLFAFGQHQALVVVQVRDSSPAWMTWLLSEPELPLSRSRLEDEFWRHARISINQGKTQVTPPNCEHLFFNANGEPSGVCRGDHNFPIHEQGNHHSRRSVGA